MSGELLRVMIVFGFSTVTVVRSGGSSPSTVSRSSRQSPSSSRSGRLKRMLSRLSVAPRMARVFAIATCYAAR
jgi:hypothetical protein